MSYNDRPADRKRDRDTDSYSDRAYRDSRKTQDRRRSPDRYEERDKGGKGARSGPGLPPAPPSRNALRADDRARSEGKATPPAKGYGGDSRTTPDGRGRVTPVPSSSNNPLLADLRKAATAALNRPASRGPQAEEEGELPQEAAADANASKRPRHSPIVWHPKAGVPGGSLLDRAQEEVLAFKMKQEDDDEHSGPILKSSPEVSDEEENEVERAMREKMRHASEAARSKGSGGEDEDDDEDLQPKPGRSRWEEAHAAAPNGNGAEAAAGPGAASGADAAVASTSCEPSPARHANGSASPSGLQMPKYDMRQECRSADEYERISKISEGTYGVVYRARHKETGKLVALKRIKMEKERDGFPVTSLREINIMLNFHHPNLANVSEIVMAPTNPDLIFMVMELMDHDLKSLMEDKSMYSRPFSIAEVKCLMQQLLRGIDFLHQNWVLHRDLKTSNILYNNKGELKICDFGLARQYGSPLGKYTQMVVTLWYRAPELLMGTTKYSTAIDMWSVGCIMGELLTGQPLFASQSGREIEQLGIIINLLGTPTDEDWPGLKKLPNWGKINLPIRPPQLANKFRSGVAGVGVSLTSEGFNLLEQLLAYDPDRRISAADALKHKWFEEVPKPLSQAMMPHFRPRRPADCKKPMPVPAGGLF